MAEDYFKEIKQMLKEVAQSQKETAEQQKKTEEEVRKTSEEVQRFIKNTNEQFRKTDEEIRKTSEEIQRLTKKTDEEIRKVNKLVAGISDGFGRMSEGFALASIEEVFKRLGIHINKTLSRVKSRKNGDHLEIDLLNVAKSEKKELIILVEVKSYLRSQDVNDFLNDISRFYDFFEEYRGKEMIGAIAFMNYAVGAKEYAEKNGLYLLFCSEDLMKMVNKKGFTPQVWRYDKV